MVAALCMAQHATFQIYVCSSEACSDLRTLVQEGLVSQLPALQALQYGAVLIPKWERFI